MFRSGERTFRSAECIYRSGERTYRSAEHNSEACSYQIKSAIMMKFK